MSENSARSALCRALGHSFGTPELLEQALTHSSHGDPHYERLEFLGDSVLNLLITEFLFEQFPGLREGKLSRIRASLVNGASLARIATGLGVGDCLLLGRGELRAGAHRRESILADCMEALIGAIYLDAGMEVCRNCVLALYRERLADPELGRPVKDSKTRLQELLMSRGVDLPVYELIAESGPPNDRIFTARCAVNTGDPATEGDGRTRRRAEQKAAERMLRQLETGTDCGQ